MRSQPPDAPARWYRAGLCVSTVLRGRGVDPKAALAHGPAVRTVFLLAALFAAPLAPPPGAAAQDASLAARVRAVGADPMELARIARDADEAVLAALADAAETARAERWAAASRCSTAWRRCVQR